MISNSVARRADRDPCLPVVADAVLAHIDPPAGALERLTERLLAPVYEPARCPHGAVGRPALAVALLEGHRQDTARSGGPRQPAQHGRQVGSRDMEQAGAGPG